MGWIDDIGGWIGGPTRKIAGGAGQQAAGLAPGDGLAKEKQEAEDEKAQRRLDTTAALQQQAAAAQAGIGAVKQAGQQGRQDLRQSLSAGLAGALGQAGGMATGGGQAAILKNAALTGGQAQARFGAEQAMRLNQAQQDAAAAQVGSLMSQQEMGSEWDNRQQKMGHYETQIQGIITANTGAFDDDGDAAYAAIMALIANETDPKVIADVTARAEQVRRDMAFFG